MRSDFDTLRDAPLPDSFDRTADWLRATPPPRTRRAPAVAFVALLVLIAAWSWPVRTTMAAGSVIEVLSADAIGTDHATLLALDQLVPDEHRHLAEVDDGIEGAGRVLRYAVLGADRADVDRWRDAVAALPSTQATRVLMIDVTQRRPLGMVTAERVLGVSTTPHLTDAELQTELDRVFAQAGTLSIRVRRTPDGGRRLQVGDALSLDVTPDARVVPIPKSETHEGVIVIRGDNLGQVRIGDESVDDLLSRSGASAFRMVLDSLPPGVAEALRERLEAHDVSTDALSADSLHLGVRVDSVSRFLMFRSDSLARPRPDSVRAETVRHIIRIQSPLRDSL